MADIAHELAALFLRDITRLRQEIASFPSADLLWRTVPGVANAAGNLALHLEGNLREYVGRQLGGIAYQRERQIEFSTRGLAIDDLMARIEDLREMVPRVIAALDAAQMDGEYPEAVLGEPMTVRYFLVHLHGHLTYHLGQINYVRRVVSSAGG